MCLATERVQQYHSASAEALLTSSVPNLLLAHAHPSLNCSISAAVPHNWEKLQSMGVELKAHHRQRLLQPRPQAASLSSALMLMSVVSPGITSLGRAAAGGVQCRA